MPTDVHHGAHIPLIGWDAALETMIDGRPNTTHCTDAVNAWEAGQTFTWEHRIYRPTCGRIAYMCDCEGALHGVNCWWSYWYDDGRDQALGDPEIDNPARQAWRDHPWPPIED